MARFRLCIRGEHRALLYIQEVEALLHLLAHPAGAQTEAEGAVRALQLEDLARRHELLPRITRSAVTHAGCCGDAEALDSFTSRLRKRYGRCVPCGKYIHAPSGTVHEPAVRAHPGPGAPEEGADHPREYVEPEQPDTEKVGLASDVAPQHSTETSLRERRAMSCSSVFTMTRIRNVNIFRVFIIYFAALNVLRAVFFWPCYVWKTQPWPTVHHVTCV